MPGRVATSAFAATLVLDSVVLASARSWPAHIVLHLACAVLGGLAWLFAVRCAPAGFRPSRVLLVAALVLQAWALALHPAESDDFHRYLWDGKVQHAGIDPYCCAPDDARLAALRDVNWSQINNAQLPTIYPPFAQLGFRLAARLPLAPLSAWKIVVAAADLGVTASLWIGGSELAALAWLASPLVLVEIGLNGHLDVLGLALVCAALLLVRRRRLLSGVFIGLATATKLLPVYLLLVVRDRRLLLGALVALLVAIAPFVGAGRQLGGSLGEFGRRWRANDGVFALVQAGARGVVWIAGKRQPVDETRLGPLARLITGRDRDASAYPDELAGALARALTLLLYVAVLLVGAHRVRDRPIEARALRLAELGFGAFLLLTPVLHPWYVLWVLPPMLLRGPERAGALPWLWLAATAPLGHVPLIAYLQGQPWTDPIWTRLVEHGPALILCAVAGYGGSTRAGYGGSKGPLAGASPRARQLSSPRNVVYACRR